MNDNPRKVRPPGTSRVSLDRGEGREGPKEGLRGGLSADQRGSEGKAEVPLWADVG